MLYTSVDIIKNVLLENIPMYSDELKKKKKIVLLNCITDKSYYKEIYNIYGVLLLRYNYGVNKYSSDLYMHTNGFNKCTMFYFVSEMFALSYFYNCMNKAVYAAHMSHLKKKFEEHTYWSISYMNRYPCRGQRRRSNASTPYKLHLLSRFNVIPIKKKNKVKVNKINKPNKKKTTKKRKK